MYIHTYIDNDKLRCAEYCRW